MSSSASSSFLLSAANVSWGRRECYTVLINDLAADMDGEYFVYDAPTSDFGANGEFYFWFDDGVAVDPAPAGRTGIAVDISGDTSAADVAGSLVTAAEANANFRAKLDAADSSNQTVILEAEFKGEVSADAADVDSGVTITKQRDGIGADLGATTGGVTITKSTNSAQVLADQTGELVRDEFYTGQSVEVSTSFLEVTPANYKILTSVVGDSYTPGGGTEVSGFGDSKLYSSFFDNGGELVLHPTNKPASDRSRDITLPLCVPKPEEMNFSGADPQALSVTFSALLDDSVRSEVRLLVFGDSSQDLRA